MSLTPDQAKILLQQIIVSLNTGATKIRNGHLDRYDFLRTQLKCANVATDDAFQKTYSGLFQARYMPKQHRAVYFSMMEENKTRSGHTFRNLLEQYHLATGRWEVSFVSKLIAIIDPNRPVWDSIVSRHLDLTLSTPRDLQNCSSAYASLEAEMNSLLKSDLFQQVKQAFSARFPGRCYSPMRILDVSIWGLG